jgi:hypothetical protein
VVNFIKTGSYVPLNDPLKPQFGVGWSPAQRAEGVVRGPEGAEAPGKGMKHAFIDGFQDHLDGGWHRPVSEASNPQRSPLAVHFGDVHALNGLGAVRLIQELLMKLLHEAIPSIGTAVDVALGDPIDSGRVTARVGPYRIQTRT